MTALCVEDKDSTSPKDRPEPGLHWHCQDSCAWLKIPPLTIIQPY